MAIIQRGFVTGFSQKLIGIDFLTDFMIRTLSLSKTTCNVLKAAKSAFLKALETLQVAFGDDKADRDNLA